MNNISSAAKWLYGCIIAGFSFVAGSLVSIFSEDIGNMLKEYWATIDRLHLALGAAAIVFGLISVGMLFALGILFRELYRLRERITELIDQINVDGRSGLSSYERLKSLYRDFYRAEIAAGKVFSALMIDIVEFKQINDTMGHSVGDQVISYIGGFLKSFVRGKRDIAARYGEAADEFFLIIEGDAAALRGFTNRLRRELTQERIETQAGPIHVDFWASGTVIDRKDDWEDVRSRLSQGLVEARREATTKLIDGETIIKNGGQHPTF